MNKNIAIVAAVIVIAGGAYLIMHKPSNQNSTKGDSSSASSQATTSEDSSLKSLLASGKSQKCTYTNTENGASSTGTFYISNGKSRGDITSNVAGKDTTTHMIYDNSTSYVWPDNSTTGFKMAAQTDQNQSQDKSQGVDPNKNYTFDCSSWIADDSMFSPPSSVEFKDFGTPAMMDASKNGTNAMMNSDTVCAALTGDAKDQCVAAMQKR